MEGTFFIFSEKKLTKSDNVIHIGKKGDYPTLENYLGVAKDEFIYDFTKNHLGKRYFSEEDCFVSFIHENPLQLRLQEPVIPRRSIVIAGDEIDLEDALINKFQYEEDDYKIFSGDPVPLEEYYRILVFENIGILVNSLYQMLNAGYLDLINVDKLDDWILTFQEPILDIFIRYHRLETSALDISTTDEFLINPEFRKTICIMLMKIVSNFIMNNGIINDSDLEGFDSWENKELWFGIREKLENEF
tara:strand:- start:27990 stop:28727 length:738 start_codon:yes stop_codon:yes gene_type:complete